MVHERSKSSAKERSLTRGVKGPGQQKGLGANATPAAHLGVEDAGAFQPDVASVIVRLFENEIAIFVKIALLLLILQVEASHLNAPVLELQKEKETKT
jgi:hypothetical protein